MNTPDSAPPKKGTSPSSRPPGPIPAEMEQAHAERRRAGLQRLLSEREMTPTDLARILEMPTPNAIYNFLSGKSASLSLDAVERILAAFPEFTFEELVGRPARWLPRQAAAEPSGGGLTVTLEANAGAWRRRVDLPPARHILLVMPEGFAPTHADAFGVLMQDRSADLFYPLGSLLVCRPLPAWPQDIPSGCRLIVRRKRERDGRVETTIRELLWDGQHAWLRPGSSRPNYAPQRVRPPLLGVMPGTRGEEITVPGVVHASIQKERITALK